MEHWGRLAALSIAAFTFSFGGLIVLHHYQLPSDGNRPHKKKLTVTISDEASSSKGQLLEDALEEEGIEMGIGNSIGGRCSYNSNISHKICSILTFFNGSCHIPVEQPLIIVMVATTNYSYVCCMLNCM